MLTVFLPHLLSPLNQNIAARLKASCAAGTYSTGAFLLCTNHLVSISFAALRFRLLT
jgi:hypothetical protein